MRYLITVVLTILICFNALPGRDRGIYFDKEYYTPEPVPVYSQVKQDLPVPVLTDQSGWIDLYWAAWEMAFSKMKQPEKGSTFVSNYLDEAFSANIFQWDTIFMVMFARYADYIFPAIQSLDNFYCSQHKNGFICREIRESDGTDFYYFLDYLGTRNLINPPLFSWAEKESYKITGDKSRFKTVIPVLEKYAEWLEKYRRIPATKHGLYWNTGLGSGMDNTPRNGSGWIDMSCQMVVMYRDLAHMCRETGDEKREKYFHDRAETIGERVNLWMWNEADGLYYDVNRDGEQIKWKTIACFWPLFADIVTRERAERLVNHLKDPKSFWREMPFPSHAADEKFYNERGGYWRGSNWAPTTYMVIKGLELAGYEEFAFEASCKYINGIYHVYQKTGTLWENYAPDYIEPGKKSRPDFVGFTGLGPIALLFENVIGIRADAAKNTIKWHLLRNDRHGIRRFRFGDVSADLICEAKSTGRKGRNIIVETNRPFGLDVQSKEIQKSYKLSAGENVLVFE